MLLSCRSVYIPNALRVGSASLRAIIDDIDSDSIADTTRVVGEKKMCANCFEFHSSSVSTL